MKAVLLAGGAGYIGSHTFLELVKLGYRPIIIDNFSNSDRRVIQLIENITNRSVDFIDGDIGSAAVLGSVFEKYSISAVIHFAAYKDVSLSVSNPSEYIQNNIINFFNLLDFSLKRNIEAFVFSSSAAVYGKQSHFPISEDAVLNYLSPYGMTKMHGEQIIESLKHCFPNTKFGILRYFNPVGAHISLKLGELARDNPPNLFPKIAKVASGKLNSLEVYKGYSNTIDGTGIRDYIHVEDLAKGHVLSLRSLLNSDSGHILNLGTGRGHSVLQVISAFETISGKRINFSIKKPKRGDVEISYADVSKANRLLDFSAEFDLHHMCETAYKWELIRSF